VQFTADDASEALVLCFRGASSQTASSVPLSRLRRDARYSIHRTDAGGDEAFTGRELMGRGLLVELAKTGASEVLQLKLRS
jgi:hypothetical protein